MIDGEIKSYAAEERFNKKKAFVGYPKKSDKFCLSFNSIKPKELDKIVFVSKNLNIDQIIVKEILVFNMKDFVREQEEYWYPKIFKKKKIDYLDVFKDKIIENEDFDFRKYLKLKKKIKNKF